MLSIEDIEEFELSSRLPRTAITHEVIQGVKKLDEIQELEAFLREIIHDLTVTPHGPTEIADIFTSHVTHQGKKLLTVFINKGKSFPKVSSKIVAHQYMKARDIPNINLIVLAAVGDIQDDARRDLIRSANDAGAEFMFVDAVDIARLLITFSCICPKDGTPYTGDGTCDVCGATREEPIEMVIQFYEKPKFELMREQDTSHNGARRVNAQVIIDRHYSKELIREIVRIVLQDLRHSDFYRSDTTKKRFSDQSADVVTLFVYDSETDRRQLPSNWVCRVSWISSDLPVQFQPMSFGGEKVSTNLEIDWNKNTEALRQAVDAFRVTKGQWITVTENLYAQAEALFNQAYPLILQICRNEIESASVSKTLVQCEANAQEIFQQSCQFQPPPECAECRQVIIQLTSALHDLLLPFSAQGKDIWKQKEIQQYSQGRHKLYIDNISAFRYEWKKMTGREPSSS